MEIIFADELGYCPGVEHALRIANNATDNADGPVYALGALIHNHQEMGRLFSKGLKVINSFSEVDEGTVVVRAHGIPYKQYDEARERGLEVKDGTCSIVTRAQRAARKLKAEGRRVLIYGDPKHPEVIGLIGAVDGDAEVISSPEEAERLEGPFDAIGLLCQTTKQPDSFRRVAEILQARGDVKIMDTICPFVIERQKHTREVAGEVNVMVIVGGRHSSNTRRLAELSEQAGARVYHVETAEDLQPEWFDGVQRVGITSGLSTPLWVVEAVTTRIREFGDQACRPDAD
jgi:4-hydroxy-3-methylbut-2-enyl diphosphate reductase